MAINRMFIDNNENCSHNNENNEFIPTLKNPGEKNKYLTVSWRPWLAGACVFD